MSFSFAPLLLAVVASPTQESQDPWAVYGQAWTTAQAGDLVEAIGILLDALEVSPESATLAYMLGHLLAFAGPEGTPADEPGDGRIRSSCEAGGRKGLLERDFGADRPYETTVAGSCV